MQVNCSDIVPDVKPDVMRSTYRELTENEKFLIAAIKQGANKLLGLMDQVTDPRAKALAKTNLEQAVMWSVKGITG